MQTPIVQIPSKADSVAILANTTNFGSWFTIIQPVTPMNIPAMQR